MQNWIGKVQKNIEKEQPDKCSKKVSEWEVVKSEHEKRKADLETLQEAIVLELANTDSKESFLNALKQAIKDVDKL